MTGDVETCNLDDYQVVDRSVFIRSGIPMMFFSEEQVLFNKATETALGYADYVLPLVNLEKQSILICESTKYDGRKKDPQFHECSTKWTEDVGGNTIAKLDGLYQLVRDHMELKWDDEVRYKIPGEAVSVEGRKAVLFRLGDRISYKHK